MLYILDYGAGNVRSLANSIRTLGHDFEWVKSPADILKADRILFPGVGAFGPALESLESQGYLDALRLHIASGKPYMGICIGMQVLFHGSTEAPGKRGLGIVPGVVERFSERDELPPTSSAIEAGKRQVARKSVPQMGWNRARPLRREAEHLGLGPLDVVAAAATTSAGASEEVRATERVPHFYFVHSYRVAFEPELHAEWTLTTTQYGAEVFVSSVLRANVFATQFHPEKSGRAGLELLRAWLEGGADVAARALASEVAQATAATSAAATAAEGAAAAAAAVSSASTSATAPQPTSSSSRPPPGWLMHPKQAAQPLAHDGLTKRVVACLDVRSNDQGDLVVTKGESYDVREKHADAPTPSKGTLDAAAAPDTASSTGAPPSSDATATTTRKVGGAVRNLGKPVDLALRYYTEGADEVVFLNITSFRSCPLADQPMLAVVEAAAACVFVPLTIGGGIKDSVEPDGTVRTAREVADAYFRAGADKVSIGSEAVYAVEEMLRRAEEQRATTTTTATGGTATPLDPAHVPESALTGRTGIETISKAYGKQAVVVSVDPRRVYVEHERDAGAAHAPSLVRGREGSRDAGRTWWYRCTVKGGREERDLDVVQLARGVQRLGAGELLVNSIDQDGRNAGFDRELVDLVRGCADIPVVASSGAGAASHFADVFAPKPLRRVSRLYGGDADADVDGSGAARTQGGAKKAVEGGQEEERPSSVEAALAAGIFHRKEVGIDEVKRHLLHAGFEVRIE